MGALWVQELRATVGRPYFDQRVLLRVWPVPVAQETHPRSQTAAADTILLTDTAPSLATRIVVRGVFDRQRGESRLRDLPATVQWTYRDGSLIRRYLDGLRTTSRTRAAIAFSDLLPNLLDHANTALRNRAHNRLVVADGGCYRERGKTQGPLFGALDALWYRSVPVVVVLVSQANAHGASFSLGSADAITFWPTAYAHGDSLSAGAATALLLLRGDAAGFSASSGNGFALGILFRESSRWGGSIGTPRNLPFALPDYPVVLLDLSRVGNAPDHGFWIAGGATRINSRFWSPAVFGRSSGAVRMGGEEVASGMPRADLGGVWIEEPQPNLLTSDQASMETGITGLAALNGATITRDTTTAWHGAASLKVVTPGAVAGEGVETSSVAVTASRDYTATMHLLGAAAGISVVVALQERDAADALIGETITEVTLPTAWDTARPFTVSLTRSFGTSGTKARLQIRTPAAQAITFWADGLQLTAAPYATSFSLPGAQRAEETLGGRLPVALRPPFTLLVAWRPLFDASPKPTAAGVLRLGTGRDRYALDLYMDGDTILALDTWRNNGRLVRSTIDLTGKFALGDRLAAAVRITENGLHHVFVRHGQQMYSTRAAFREGPISTYSVGRIGNGDRAIFNAVMIVPRTLTDPEITMALSAMVEGRVMYY